MGVSHNTSYVYSMAERVVYGTCKVPLVTVPRIGEIGHMKVHTFWHLVCDIVCVMGKCTVIKNSTVAKP